ncbi:transcriptional regulator [Chitinophaga sp. SYP-B3965]|uniref:transcriptional regulator n=1 Tax=Chitinophaga sp. SYP-B3965 TaxID=2663120 RepID=UPI001299B0E2|nr:transcriptional regulator [Chitinophaga sp. SYP-B3965]MRG45036.1 transcriptional regulator [Chitinophaga sp. SYP-B3965]
METTILDKDMKVFYVTAAAFPEGVIPAHEKLHSMVPFSTERAYLGISRPENGGGIVYRAATEETFQGEAEQYKCDTLILKKGKYLSLILKDYAKDPLSFKKAFDKLLNQPGLDPNGYCVEWYINGGKDAKCMIRLA